MEGVPDGFLGIVGAALRARARRRSILVWEGDGAERFFDAWDGKADGGEVWIFQVTGWGHASTPHAMIRRKTGVRLFRVQRHEGWEPSDLALRADVYVFIRQVLPADLEESYPVSRIGRVISRGGVLMGTRSDVRWISAAERAGFVGEAGFAVPDGVWAKSFVGRVTDSGWGGIDGGRVAVIGAGLAGSAVADGLALRGVEVDVFDGSGIGQAASGNRAAVLVPMVSMDDGLPARLSRFGCHRVGAELRVDGTGKECGVLQLAVSERIRRVRDAGSGGEGFRVVDSAEAEELSGMRGIEGGLWFSEAGWIDPSTLCGLRLARHGCRVAFRRERVTGFEQCGRLYSLHGEGKKNIGEGYGAVVLATAGIPDWMPWEGQRLGMKLAWGRNVTLEAERLAGLRAVVTGAGYCIPLGSGFVHLGATYEFEEVPTMDDGSAVDVIWEKSAGAWAGQAPRGAWEVRRAMRVLTADRLPMVGQVGDSGVFIACGLGSRGAVWSGVVGELIPALAMGEPSIFPRAWVEALEPARFSGGIRGRGRP